ncbi:MAG: hypothetical protein KAH03_02765 [Cocleimonas sp.]|nr:hypothetical protein [Cocleimonas sp.]
MLDTNYTAMMNQNTLQNTTTIATEHEPLESDVAQMNTFGDLFEGDNGMEMLTFLLQLIMQLVQDLGLIDPDSTPPQDEGNPIEELLKRSLFMSLLTDSSFDAGPSYELFGNDEKSGYA